jgi:hypothetical protein
LEKQQNDLVCIVNIYTVLSSDFLEIFSDIEFLWPNLSLWVIWINKIMI